MSLSRRQAYLYCEVRVSDYTFGNQIPSDEITVTRPTRRSALTGRCVKPVGFRTGLTVLAGIS